MTPAIRSLLAQFDEIIVVGHAVASSTEMAGFDCWKTQSDSDKVKLLTCEQPQQSYKRMMAFESTEADVIYFIDDDAIAKEDAYQQIESVFSSDEIGLITGPSLLPAEASLWQRVAQMAVANNPISGPRYGRHAFDDDVISSRVIGCNMAVRKDALSGFSPEVLPSYGEEWALAEYVKAQGYRLAYNPNQIVYHAPHGFMAHSRQVYRWGKTSTITGAGNIDPANVLYPLVIVWFGLLWGTGRLVARRSNKNRQGVR